MLTPYDLSACKVLALDNLVLPFPYLQLECLLVNYRIVSQCLLDQLL